MKKVITYGTYDLLHYGHIRLLERAKELGDYLIVGVTADDFDKTRGKINVQQSLMERVEAVRATGIADEIIIEEYEGQKIDDIRKYDIDIFTVGSDWVGYFDYLKEYCDVVYLERTQGVSSTEIRAEKRRIRLGIVGDSDYLYKFFNECKYVNGIEVKAICTKKLSFQLVPDVLLTSNYDELLNCVDAVYLHSSPKEHYSQIIKAIKHKVHVMCESPITMERSQCEEVIQLAKDNNIILMDSLRTAFSTAFDRLILLVKSGKIGNVVSVNSTCTLLRHYESDEDSNYWNSMTAWGPTALLPVFKIIGLNYEDFYFVTRCSENNKNIDAYTKLDIFYKNAVGTVSVGFGVKSDNSLIITGTKGYIYVPSPWWKTDYFEIRYENSDENKRYFYQLDGEGIRNEVVTFIKLIANIGFAKIEKEESVKISEFIEKFSSRENTLIIK